MTVKSGLWQAYQDAFAEFSRKSRRLQSLATQSNPDPEALFDASQEVDQAHKAYNRERDALVQEFLPWWPGSASVYAAQSHPRCGAAF